MPVHGVKADFAPSVTRPWNKRNALCVTRPFRRLRHENAFSIDVNMHLLGQQWIEEVTDARKSSRGQKEGEHLEFRRASEDGLRRNWCNYLLKTSDSKLRAELLGERQKDVLIIPGEWYPDDIPIDSAPGWWYVPAGAIVGRQCQHIPGKSRVHEKRMGRDEQSEL